MKKLYTLLAALTVGAAAYAQCTPNPALFGAANNTNYTIIPDTVTNLPVAYIGVGYNTDLQFHIQPDTTTGLGTFPITKVHIDSVTGLPANFSYMPNPSNGTFSTPNDSPPGTGYGCVAVTGNAVSGQETGGINSDGVYPVVVYYTATVVVFSVPTDFPAEKHGYKVRIVDPNSVPTIEILKFAVAQNSPNPADNSTQFRISAPNSGPVQINVYNVLGAEMRNQSMNVAKGVNTFTLDTQSWAEGVYMCSFRMGNAVVTRRITVTH